MTEARFARSAIILCGLWFTVPLFAQDAKKKEDETYPVRIILEARPDAKFYQVEWLENNDISGQAEASPALSLREKVARTEIKTNLPVRFKYFRLRSAYRDGLYGEWGQVVEIQRPVKIAVKKEEIDKKYGAGAKPVKPQEIFAQVIDRDGKEKWVLRGTAVPAEKLDLNDPLYYDVECLSEKDAPENTNGRKKYEGPVPFARAGQYKMNLYNSEDPAITTPMQTWIFWVYTDVPRTNVKFYAPFLHGKGGFTVGAKTKISLQTQIGGAAIDKIEYRVFAEGTQPGAWVKFIEDIEVNSFAKRKYGQYNIEFQATNVAGAAEAPQLKRMLVDARPPLIEELPREGGVTALTIKDENFPIVVRIYHGGKLIEDKYFKMWRTRDTLKLPAEQGIEIHVIDLLGNETILKK